MTRQKLVVLDSSEPGPAPQAGSLAARQSAALYGGLALLCLALVWTTLNLGRADLSLPLVYNGDGLQTAMFVKALGDHGWIYPNPSLGAPGFQDIRDYPILDTLHLLILRGLCALGLTYGAAMNAYFLASFPLTGITALFALRRLGVSPLTAALGGLLYAFLPYHFMRGEFHFFLAQYWHVPLLALLLLRVADGRPFRPEGRLRAALLCLLAASAGVYYAFFAALLLLCAGVIGGLAQRRAAPVRAALGLSLVLALGVGLNLTPYLLYWHQAGHDPAAIARSPSDSERYALRLTQLVLPVTEHRNPLLGRIKADYNDESLLINENDTATLGLFGTAGFLLLLGIALLPSLRRTPTLSNLASLNLACFLLATFGGIGALLSLGGLSQMRGYNRISVFIAFFALAALLLVLDALRDRYASQDLRRWFPLFLILAGFAGWRDQTPVTLAADYTGLTQAYRSDAQFVRAIEAREPVGAMIFELPYVPFPEAPRGLLASDYQQGRGYLHSRTLRWSYGVVKGRPADRWNQAAAAQPVPQMVRTLADSGWGGIWINRGGYADDGQRLCRAISASIGAAPMLSRTGELAFFDLTAYRARRTAPQGAPDGHR